MAFFLFILVNATLFIRPAEIIPEWQGLSIYEFLIIACFLLALPEVLAYFSRRLDAQPITLCVFGLLLMIVLAQLVALNVEKAWDNGFLFFKVMVYYILLVSLVNTPGRLRWFLVCLVGFCGILALATLLQYHGVVTLPTMKKLVEFETDQITGDVREYRRLQGSGIFSDPNELGVMLATAVPLALFFLTRRRSGLSRLVSLGCLPLFFYAIALTHSRGAFLALLAALGGFAVSRFGWRKAILWGMIGCPVLVLGFAGRQTDLSAAAHGTGQSRLQIWSNWLQDFRANPLFGKGLDMGGDPEKAKEKVVWADERLVAHNSYLHGFRDLGFAGGCFFLGAFLLAFWSLRRLHPHQTIICQRDLRRLRPYLIGTLAGYGTGILLLSLCYAIPTYLVLGLVVVFDRTATPWPPLAPLRCNTQVASRLAFASVAFLTGLYLVVRLFVNFS